MTPVAVIFIVAASVMVTALITYLVIKVMRLKEALEEKEAELKEERERSMIDPLTGVYNRRGLDRETARAVEHSRRHDRPLSLMMIDVDNFKEVNDTHGHQAGDRVLRDIAKILLFETRHGDVVARWGGDEMAVLLLETNGKNARMVAEKIREKVANHRFPVNGISVSFTVSIGLATFPGSAQDFAELEFKADEAANASKRKGKNCVTEASALDTVS